MGVVNAFTPQGNTVAFTANTAAPSPVQCTGQGFGGIQYRIYNSGSVNVFLGVGTTSSDASNNAVVVTSNGTGIVLPPGDLEVMTMRSNAYFTGITASGNAVVYIVAGEGQ